MKRSTSPIEDNNLTPSITHSCSTDTEAPPPLKHKEISHRFTNLQVPNLNLPTSSSNNHTTIPQPSLEHDIATLVNEAVLNALKNFSFQKTIPCATQTLPDVNASRF
ncbi:hypothetical protein GcM3_211020 [Golovinomyces cichoracearum]|uniref:Uncharacterized protein n=1 Tax=Golovinomyces cichoracearum TaxID=62708 RepID=A0A420H9V0_9PEZI|nr:hypothetical protein GcM3_211020 [Golovinomyces cichoracearum]